MTPRLKKFNKDTRTWHSYFLDQFSPIIESFDPVLSINSGQVFLWEKHGSSWYGVYGDYIIKFSYDKEKETCEFLSFPDWKAGQQTIFRLNDDIREIRSQICSDPLIRKLVMKYPGLRIIRQPPHQCVFSFVCATNTNVPMIRRMLLALSRKFGSPVTIDGIEFFTFPSPEKMNAASIDELRACGLGYRAKAVKAVAESIVSRRLDFESLANASYDDAKADLLKVYGIGNKIADCVLLFSLEKLEAFPIDVWIARALATNYKSLHSKVKFSEKFTARQYELVSESVRNYFGKYAGYAQQYLYYHIRHSAGKKW